MACEGVIASSPRLHPHACANAIFFLLLTISVHPNTCSGQSEADILIQFKDSLGNNGALSNWNRDVPPCSGETENWVGLLCEKGYVWGLLMENMGLTGTINVDILTRMPKLRIVSFVNNNLEGPLPDFSKLHSLKAIFLSNNKFSGEIRHDMFRGMMALKKIHLDHNRLSGSIPVSVPGLPRLIELNLQNNEFSGFIPPFPPHKIRILDLSNNKLEGEIPRALSHFPVSSFEGNKDLCGAPLRSCTAPNELSLGTIITVVILLVVTGSALVAVVVILLRRKSPPADQPPQAANPASAPGQAQKRAVEDLDHIEKGQAAAAPPPPTSSTPEKHRSSQAKKQEANMKITFLQEDSIKFDMSDLLKASAEVLGSGVFGSTYKADLGNGRTVVVKRYKHMNNVNKQDFCEHMRRLGRLSHPNLLTVLGYYYRKEEKLFVTSYVENVSLAVLLHGNTHQSSLDWPTRLRIIKGVSKGLLYLYNELPSLTAPHGHLKSSNVLLDAANNPLLNDYCLLPIVNQEDARQFMIAYKSPEFQSGRITKKTDVWSLGILILEILTGKFPPNFLQQGKASSNEPDVAAWVESVVGSEPYGPDIFDKTINKATRCEEDMMELLEIGLSCCQVDPEKRPDIKEVVEKIEVIKEEES